MRYRWVVGPEVFVLAEIDGADPDDALIAGREKVRLPLVATLIDPGTGRKYSHASEYFDDGTGRVLSMVKGIDLSPIDRHPQIIVLFEGQDAVSRQALLTGLIQPPEQSQLDRLIQAGLDPRQIEPGRIDLKRCLQWLCRHNPDFDPQHLFLS